MRRKFSEAQEQAPRIVGWLLRQISHLYVIEESGYALDSTTRKMLCFGECRVGHRFDLDGLLG
jgi:hypothetical protein